MDLKSDKNFLMALLGISGKGFSFSVESVKQLFNSNGLEFDQSLYSHYSSEDYMVKVQDWLIRSSSNVSSPVEAAPKKEEAAPAPVEPEVQVDFSAFF